MSLTLGGNNVSFSENCFTSASVLECLAYSRKTIGDKMVVYSL